MRPGAGRALRQRGLAAVAALALIAGASFASAADPADAANAKQRFLAGAQLYSQGKFSDAVDQFLAADRIGPSAALSFDIARSYEKLGETSLTLRWYRDYLHRAGNPADAAKVHRTIVSLEHELQNKGVQQITVRSIPRGATVAIDGEPAGVTPMTTDLPPGRHRLTMTHDGYEKAERLFNLAPDEAQDIDTRLAQAAPAAAAPAVPAPVPGEPPPDSAAQAPPSAPYTAPAPRSQAASPTMRTLGIIGMSVGGAALGTSLAFEILRRDSVNDAKNDPTQVGYASKLNAANDRQTASRVLLGVGAGLAVTGGVLFFVGARSTHSTEIALGCSPALCGARAFGRF